MPDMKSVGSRASVMHGNAKKTSGGLTKAQLKYNKQGRIVSRKASTLAKKNNRLVKAGYVTKKGQFGTGGKMRGGGEASKEFLDAIEQKNIESITNHLKSNSTLANSTLIDEDRTVLYHECSSYIYKNYKDNTDYTKQLQIIELLINAGADLNAKSKDRTILDLLCNCFSDIDGLVDYIPAARNTSFESNYINRHTQGVHNVASTQRNLAHRVNNNKIYRIVKLIQYVIDRGADPSITCTYRLRKGSKLMRPIDHLDNLDDTILEVKQVKEALTTHYEAALKYTNPKK